MATKEQKGPTAVLPSRERGLCDKPDRQDAGTSDGQTEPLPPAWEPVGQVVNEIVEAVRRSLAERLPKSCDDAPQDRRGNTDRPDGDRQPKADVAPFGIGRKRHESDAA